MQRDTGQYLEIDVYANEKEYAILEVELPTAESQVYIPGYLTVVKEVTENPVYRNVNIASVGHLPHPEK